MAEAAAGQILSLPMHPHLTEAQQERVVEVLAAAVGEPVDEPVAVDREAVPS